MKKIILSLRNRLWLFLLYVRGISFKEKSSRLSNLYLLTMQKSGCQWIKQILNDKRIKAKTKLMIYWQNRYEWNEFNQKFPKGTFVPGL